MDRMHELNTRLAEAGTQQEQIDLLNELAWEMRLARNPQAMDLYQQTYTLSQTGEYHDQPYRWGVAASLVGQASLHTDQCNLDQAVSLCFEALSWLEGQVPSVLHVDAWRTLSWVHIYLADYPTAMQWGMKSLNLARQLGARLRAALSLDTMATIQSLLKDLSLSVHTHQEALHIVRQIGHCFGEAIILNNMALSLLDAGDADAALTCVYQALQIDQEQGLVRSSVNATDTLARILLKTGKLAEAETALQNVLADLEQIPLEIVHVYFYRTLGEVYQAENKLDQAETHFRLGLAAAEKLGTRNEEAQCHRYLSQIYERRGDFCQSLEHYKHYHILMEMVAGEDANRRLAVLKVTYEVETAQRDAEIHRLRNVELQSEIEERKRIQTVLEKLATLDPLTNLYNRRHFMTLAERELERTMRYQHPLVVLMLDLDHFKRVNDTYGHAVGDQVLVRIAGILQANLREIDIIGRYGGEEFAVVLPDVSIESGLKAGERVRLQIAGHPISTDAGDLAVTVSVGVAGWHAGASKSGLSLDKLLNLADQALYSAKRVGRNCTQLALPDENSPDTGK